MNDRPVSKILDTLQSVSGHKPTRNGKGWIARCPAHDDRKPSLSISEGDDGRALLHCHAGCETTAIVSALGMLLSDLMPSNNGNGRVCKRKPATPKKTAKVFPSAREAIEALERKHGPRSASWTYHDGEGEPVGTVVRWNLPDGSKDIRPVSLLPDRDGWVIGAMPTPRPLYGLPDLAEAQTVVVAEGEKAADAARSLGFTVTTSSGGSQAASKTDWVPLAGKDVTILPDNDEPGKKYAGDVAKILSGLSPAPVVRIVALPGLPEKGDVVDFLASRRGEGITDDKIKAKIEALAKDVEPVEIAPERPTRSPILVRLSDVKPEPVRWLWPGRIALGKPTMVSGNAGLGKSTITLDMAARVSTGTPWPDATGEPNPAGGVVILTAEDDLSDTVRPRLDAAQADVSRIVSMQGVRVRDIETGEDREEHFDLTCDLAALEAAILATDGCRLAIIDPLTAYLGKTDSHNNAEVRAVLARLNELAVRTGVALVCVNHLNKSSTMPAIHRTMGSVAFVAAARAVWGVMKDKDDPSGRRRFFLPIKNNNARDETGMAYRLESVGDVAVVAWEPEPVSISADDALAAGKGDDESAACEFLRKTLSGGEQPSADVLKQGIENGLKEKPIRKAFKAIGGVQRREGFGKGSKVLWHLPTPPPIDSPDSSILGIDSPPQGTGKYGKYGDDTDDGPPPPSGDGL